MIAVEDLGGETSATVTGKLFPRSSSVAAGAVLAPEAGDALAARACGGRITGRSDTRQTTMTRRKHHADIITQTGFVPVRVGAPSPVGAPSIPALCSSPAC